MKRLREEKAGILHIPDSVRTEDPRSPERNRQKTAKNTGQGTKTKEESEELQGLGK